MCRLKIVAPTETMALGEETRDRARLRDFRRVDGQLRQLTIGKFCRRLLSGAAPLSPLTGATLVELLDRQPLVDEFLACVCEDEARNLAQTA